VQASGGINNECANYFQLEKSKVKVVACENFQRMTRTSRVNVHLRLADCTLADWALEAMQRPHTCRRKSCRYLCLLSYNMTNKILKSG